VSSPVSESRYQRYHVRTYRHDALARHTHDAWRQSVPDFREEVEGRASGIGGRRRGKQLAKLYKALPKAELTKLKTEAARTPFKRSCVKRAPKTRKPHKFAKFVAANYKSVRSVPYKKRLAALAAKWKKAQK